MLKSRAPFFLLAVATLHLLSTSVSSGETPSGSTQSRAPSAAADVPDSCLSDEKCKEFYELARRQSDAGQLEAALINYQNAYARKPAPWLLISIGRIYHKLQRFQLAIDNFKKYLVLPASETEEELRITAETYLREARQQMKKDKGSHLQPSPDLPATGTSSPLTQPTHTVAATSVSQASERQPVYKKWWFGTILGGAVAAVVVGTVIGVSAREPDLSGMMQFRPFASNQ